MKRLKKISLKILLTIALLACLERLIRTQTSGFRLAKTTVDFPYCSEWDVDECRSVPEVLDQPFYFLDSGVQCYAFLSEDQTTVLKLFKHYHAGLSSKQLRKFPHWMGQKILVKRAKRIASIFSSAILAYQQLPNQTGVFYINLNEQKNKYKMLTIYDKIGIQYEIDLNQTPFVLQKKAELILPYLENHPDQAPHVIDSLFSCIQNRRKIGIDNYDPNINTNFGVYDGKVVEIDVGSFFESPEVATEPLDIKKWLKKYAPKLNDYLES